MKKLISLLMLFAGCPAFAEVCCFIPGTVITMEGICVDDECYNCVNAMMAEGKNGYNAYAMCDTSEAWGYPVCAGSYSDWGYVCIYADEDGNNFGVDYSYPCNMAGDPCSRQTSSPNRTEVQPGNTCTSGTPISCDMSVTTSLGTARLVCQGDGASPRDIAVEACKDDPYNSIDITYEECNGASGYAQCEMYIGNYPATIWIPTDCSYEFFRSCKDSISNSPNLCDLIE